MAYFVVALVCAVISIVSGVVNSRRKKEWKAKLTLGDQFSVALPREEVVDRFKKAGWLGESKKKFGANPMAFKNLGVETPEGLLLTWRAPIGAKLTDVKLKMSGTGASTLIETKYSYNKGNNDTLNRSIQEFETEIRYMFRDALASADGS